MGPTISATRLVPIPAMITPTATRAAIPASDKTTRSATATAFTALWKGRSPAAAADSVWVPAVSGALVMVVGAVALASGQPVLFAALGPSALLIAATPGHSTTRFHAIVLGHLTAIVCAWLALLLLGAGRAPSMLGGELPVVRVWASALAVAVTALVQPSLRAWHPPAAATALLLTLGAYRLTWKNSLSLMAGVLVLALLGEWFQRLRLTQRRAAR